METEELRELLKDGPVKVEVHYQRHCGDVTAWLVALNCGTGSYLKQLDKHHAVYEEGSKLHGVMIKVWNRSTRCDEWQPAWVHASQVVCTSAQRSLDNAVSDARDREARRLQRIKDDRISAIEAQMSARLGRPVSMHSDAWGPGACVQLHDLEDALGIVRAVD